MQPHEKIKRACKPTHPDSAYNRANLTRQTLGRKEERTDNKGFAIAGVLCFVDTLVQGGSSVLRMKFSAKTPRHRKPPKR